MLGFVYANELVFCLTLLLYLLIALIGVICFAMSISYKLKIVYILPEIVISLIAIILFCYLSDGIRIIYLNKDPNELVNSICFLPLWSVLLIAFILLALVIFWVFLVIKKRLSSLTAMSIKEALSILPNGLCFYDNTGRVLLLNEQIDNECRMITGKGLYDGITFYESMNNGNINSNIKTSKNDDGIIVEFINGKTIYYKHIVHNLNNKTIYEISGTDISYEFELKKQIEQKNEELRAMNFRLRQYGKIVDEITKEKETLAARINVHSNLGSLILQTKKALSNGNYDVKSLIDKWNDIMSLIFASQEKEDKIQEIEKNASSMGVKVIYDGVLPKKGSKIESIFATSLFECVVNTARHANGNKLYVKIENDKNNYIFSFTNNGIKPNKNIKEGGGLSSLRTMIENINGQMKIISVPDYKLIISIPKEVTKDE